MSLLIPTFSILTIIYTYCTRIYLTKTFITVITITIALIILAPGVIGSFLLITTMILLILQKKKGLEHFKQIGTVTLAGFLISLLFFKFFFISEIQEASLIFSNGEVNLFRNLTGLTITLQGTIENIQSFSSDQELIFAMDVKNNGINEFLFFLAKFKKIDSVTDFVTIYYFCMSLIFDHIPFVKVFIKINLC